jgi:hypothetical protein
MASKQNEPPASTPTPAPVDDTIKPVLPPVDDVVLTKAASSIKDIDPRDVAIPDIRTILGEFDQVIPNQVETHPAWHSSWVDDRNMTSLKTMGWRFVRRESVVEHGQELGLYDVRVSGSISALTFDGADCVKNTDGHYLMLVPKQIAKAFYQARANQSTETLKGAAQADNAIQDMERLGNPEVAEIMQRDSKSDVSVGNVVQEFMS